MTTLANKMIAVIGGNSGIGLRVAELAAAEQASLLIIGKTPKSLAEAQQHLTA